MNLEKYTLNEDFDILATWFRKDQNLADGIKGTLHYGQSSIILELFDSFGDTFSHTYDNLQWIYGFSQDGKLLALKECSKIQGHESFPGFSIESYSVNGFYILDVNFNKIEGKTRVETAFSKVFGNSQSEFLVESITFSVNHLHKWINKSRASIIEFPERNKGAIQFDLDKHDQSTFSISSENLSLLESVTIVTSSNRIAHTIEEKPYLKIFENNGEKRSFHSFFQNATYIKKLIEFLNGMPLHFQYLEFLCEKDTIPENSKRFYPVIKGRYFFKQIGEPITTTPKNPLTLRSVENEFENILDSWYLKKEKLSFIIDSYLNDLYLPYYIETQLLNSIRNLEIYYRNFVNDSIEQKKEELKEDQQLLTDYVNENVSQPNKEHFIANVNFIGEDSLQKKLSHLFRKLPDKIFESCIKKEGKSPSKSSSSLARSLTQTRNFHTHGYKPDLYPDRIQGAHNFFKTNEKLKLFQRYFIYKELGLSEDTILKVLIPETYEFQNTLLAEK